MTTKFRSPVAIYIVIVFLGLYSVVGLSSMVFLAARHIDPPGELISTVAAALTSLGGIGYKLIGADPVT